MIKIDTKWSETNQSFLEMGLDESNPHLRKRYIALYFIASGEPCIKAAEKVDMNRVTVSNWVHQFNENGLEALIPQWKGNPGRILTDEELEALKEAVKHHPREIGIKKGRWTAKTVSAYAKKMFGVKIHQDTARNYLLLLGFSYKRPGKRLVKADPAKQEEFAKNLEQLEANRTPRAVTTYVDEGKIEQDALPRKGWFIKDQPAEVDSTSPGKKKILFYSAVARPLGKVITMQVDSFNQQNSARFLYKIRKELPGYRIDLVWDNAPWHGGRSVQKALSKTRIREHRLAPYSPKMNACEYFIRWAKEILSYNFCWKDLISLKQSFRAFVASLARKADLVLQRCKPKMFGFNVV